MATPTLAFLNTSLTDTLTDALRRAVLSGEFVPDQRLSENAIAERFGVARTTAKTGIDRLCAEGLLRRCARKSAHVPLLSGDDIADLYFSREPIEVAAVRLLAAGGGVPEGASAALARMRKAALAGDHADHTEADIQMHREMVLATGSERLHRMHDLVMGETQLCISQVRRHSGVDLMQLTDVHASILEAIAAQDAKAAVDALRHDLHSCRDLLVREARRIEAGAHRDDMGHQSDQDGS
jgi:DNA-binding GntR family transcriptional regulator